MAVAGLLPNVGKIVDGGDNSKVSLLFGRTTPGQIGELVLDITVNEDHQYSNTVTSFPVENGSEVTDHVRQEPEVLSLDGVVSKAPVQFLGGVRKLANFILGKGEGNDRVQAAFESLLRDAGYDFPEQQGSELRARNVVKPIDIVTGLRAYNSMILTRLNFRRDKNTGEALRFSMSAKKVKFVESPFEINTFTSDRLSGKVAGNKQSSSNKKDVGNQGTEEVELESTANAVFEAIF